MTGPYRKPWPWQLRQDVALIVHIDAAALLAGQRSDLISLVPVDLEVGRQGAALAVAVREWGKLDGCGAAIGPAATKNARPVDSDSPPAVAPVEPTAADEPTTLPAAVYNGNANTVVNISITGVDPSYAVASIEDAMAAYADPTPVEGDDLNGPEYAGQWDALQRAYQALDKAAQAWVRDLRKAAVDAGVSFNSGDGNRTVRRFEILRGLTMIAGTDWQTSIRDFVFTCTNSETVHLDRYNDATATATLNAAQATQFATLCEYAIIDGLVAEPRDAFRIRYTLTTGGAT